MLLCFLIQYPLYTRTYHDPDHRHSPSVLHLGLTREYHVSRTSRSFSPKHVSAGHPGDTRQP